MLIKPTSTDSSHWYTRDGQPCHEIECATKPGQMRPVDVRDARKLGLLPSVTNVLSVIEKKNLMRWKIEQAILSALTLPKLDSETEDHYAARVAQDAEAESRKAMDFGTRLHEAIEFVLMDNSPRTFDADIEPFVEPFCSFWTAIGENESRGYVVDFKTQGKLEYPMTFYPEWCWQLGAYQDALAGMPTVGIASEIIVASPRGYGGRVDFVNDDGGRLGCASIAISSKVPGLIELKKWTTDEVENGKRVFFAALELWTLIKKYDPRKELPDANERQSSGNHEGNGRSPRRPKAGR